MKVDYHNTKPIDIDLMILRTDHKTSDSPVNAIILIIIALIGIVVPVWLKVQAQKEITEHEAKIAEVKADIAELQAQLSEQSATAGVSEYLTLPEQVRQTRPQLTYVLDKLNELLPLETNVSSLSFSNSGTIQLTAAFATSENIISFMHEVDNSERFNLIKIGAMNQAAVEDVEENTVSHREDIIDGDAGFEATSHDVRDIHLPVILTSFELEYHPASSDESGGES